MKILLAIDTSAASQLALQEVAARPWPVNSSCEVLSVVEPSHLWTTSEAAQEAASCAEDVVCRATERLRTVNLLGRGVVLSGEPKTVIVNRARTAGADLLVVGSHGASAISRFLLGNVAAAVLRHSSCSVEVVRGKAGKDRAAGMKILLATDGSEFSDRAAASIVERPWPEGTEIRVLSVVELVLPPVRAMIEVPMIDTAFLETARGEAMQRAEDAIARARQILSTTPFNVSESISVLADGPRTVILKEAEEWGADLIVLGSHGRLGLDRLMVGSVSESVATHAACSVEIVRKN